MSTDRGGAHRPGGDAAPPWLAGSLARHDVPVRRHIQHGTDRSHQGPNGARRGEFGIMAAHTDRLRHFSRNERSPLAGLACPHLRPRGRCFRPPLPLLAPDLLRGSHGFGKFNIAKRKEATDCSGAFAKLTENMRVLSGRYFQPRPDHRPPPGAQHRVIPCRVARPELGTEIWRHHALPFAIASAAAWQELARLSQPAPNTAKSASAS